MVLRRKIYSKLLDWKNDSNGNKTISLEGARRNGKSTIVEEFAKNEYTSYIVIDFAKKNSEVEQYFINYLNDLDTFFMMLSTYYGVKLSRRNSLIIFDEVQMFPLARAAIKYLVANEIYDEQDTDCCILEIRFTRGMLIKDYHVIRCQIYFMNKSVLLSEN
ncbi:AAA family ATPase [Amedibacillus sp. YH-ame10]